MKARYPGNCDKCGVRIEKDEECTYDSATRRISHYDCPVKKDLFSASEAEAIATRLHFIPAAESDNALPLEWFA